MARRQKSLTEVERNYLRELLVSDYSNIIEAFHSGCATHEEQHDENCIESIAIKLLIPLTEEEGHLWDADEEKVKATFRSTKPTLKEVR